MLIPLLVFVPRKGANALNATLSPKASPCCRSADKAIPKLLSTPGSGRNQESPPAGCLVPSPCERIKPVIYCTSIRQRERSCFRQLLFCSQDLRASLRGSACLHDNSSCCQNHTSPFFQRSVDTCRAVTLWQPYNIVAAVHVVQLTGCRAFKRAAKLHLFSMHRKGFRKKCLAFWRNSYFCILKH